MTTLRPPLAFRFVQRSRRHPLGLAGLCAIITASCIASIDIIGASSARAQSAPETSSKASTTAAVPDSQSDKGREFTAIVVPATVQAFFVADLYAKDSGYISKLNVDIGDHVKKGQLLAVIDDPELQAQFDKARAAVQQTKAALEVAKRQMAAMQADLAFRQATLTRQRALFVGKAATAQSLDEAKTKEGVSQANLETATAKIALAEADVAAAEAEAQRLHALVQYDRILAPFDSVVTRRLVNPGDLVQTATSSRARPLFTCQSIDKVRVLADVPEVSAGYVHPGLAAEVKPLGDAAVAIHGSVSRIAGALDPATRTMRVEIDLPNHDEKLLPGMYAQVTLGSSAQQLNLPKR